MNDVMTIREQSCDNTVKFWVGDKTILILDGEGMTYNGEFIRDAGEAHKSFLETMEMMRISHNG